MALSVAYGDRMMSCSRVELTGSRKAFCNVRPAKFSSSGATLKSVMAPSFNKFWSIAVSMQADLGGDASGDVSQYPPGVQRYESMVIVRPDISDEDRIKLIERYEEVRFLNMSALSLLASFPHLINSMP